MYGIFCRSLFRRSVTSVEECYKLVDNNKLLSVQELYGAFKYMASDADVRKSVIRDYRLMKLLSYLNDNLATVNTTYLGNFAMRLVLLSQSNNYIGDRNDINVECIREIINKMSSVIVNKNPHIKELTQVAYASAMLGGTDESIYEHLKQQLTLNIELATPDSINLTLQTLFKKNIKDFVFISLLCEKLSELTDRFTTNDVLQTLKSLSKIGLLKGFLLRRLLTLIFDNLDQFTHLQLVQCAYRLASLKFLTADNFNKLYKSIQGKLSDLQQHHKIELLMSSCLVGGDENVAKLLDDIDFNKDLDLLSLIEYIYVCVFYKKYCEILIYSFKTDDSVENSLNHLDNKISFISRKYALLLKELIDTLSLEYKDIKIKSYDSLKSYEDKDQEYNERSPMFQEVKRVLSDDRFKAFQRIGPYQVTFVDENRKLCIELEHGTLLSNMALKIRGLEGLGYNCQLVKYWEWRRLKTERDELLYAFRLFDINRTGKLTFLKFKALLDSIGIYLTKQELKFLQYEEDMRGYFTLDNLYAIGQVFYNDEVIKEKVIKSFKVQFSSFNKEQLKKLLIKLGTGIRIGESEVESFFNHYLSDAKDLNIEQFVDM